MSKAGPWTPRWSSPPVTATDIRRWAIAVYWPEQPPRIYWDAAYASTTRWNGIIAPPDFNPFAWPIDRPERASGSGAEQFPDHPHVMNGGLKDRYGAPIRPGDVISERSRVSDVTSRKTRLGDTRFVATEYEWVNQDDAVVRHRIWTLIRY